MSLKEAWLAPGVVKEIVKWVLIGALVIGVAVGLINPELISSTVHQVAGWIKELRSAAQ